MEVTILPTELQGELTIPASKSFMQRACAAALIKGGKTILTNYGISNDDKAVLDVIQQLGAKVTLNAKEIIIESVFNTNNSDGNKEINLGESGLGLRMFTPITALLNEKTNIHGHGSLTKRPMHFFDEILPQLTVQFKSNNGFLPFEVKGPMEVKDIEVDGSLSSQFLTGLLMAYSYSNKAATITVHNLTSKPYIDITLEVLKSFGLNVPENVHYEKFIFTEKKATKNVELNYAIESDWSSASFLLVAAAINGNCIFNGLNMQSVQADKKILEALERANAKMHIDGDSIYIAKNILLPFEFDATECPDLFPPLVALASYANGTTIIKGANRLTHKESNRALTLQEEFKKLGVKIILMDDEMHIIGTGQINVFAETFDSHNDHRIAMALAVAALDADKGITIKNAEAINKSYPGFYEDLGKLMG